MKSIPLIAALLVFAATASAADKWTSVQSENFLLVGSASESHMRDVAENLELFRTAYGKFFPLQEKSATIDTTVIVFKSDAAFRPYKPLYQGKPANIAGYFQGGEDKNLIVLSADIETPRAIYHEYVHRLMSGNLSSLPPWFQEGFAECFSTLEIEGKDKKLRLGRAIPEHVALLNQRRFLPLERLFAVTADSREYNDGEKQGLFYAESWALVHYMMLGPQDRRTRFFEFLEGLKEGTPAPEVFRRVFQTDLGTFQKTFEAYIHQRLVWPAMEMAPSGRLDRNKDLTSRTLTEAEAEFYLGDMLLHDDRLAAAEPHLLSALRLDPSLAVAHVGMGKLRLRQNRDLEARTYLERGTQLDPDNHLAHYFYAGAIQGGNRVISESDLRLARAELRKSIELAPQFVVATEQLANLNLVTDNDMPQTIDLLRKARAFAPGNDNLTVMLAFALRIPDPEEARSLALSVLKKHSITPAMRKNAETVLSAVDQMSAHRQAPPTTATREVSARINGKLTAIGCTEDSITLVLLVDGQAARQSGTLSEVRFAAPVGCGPLSGGGTPVLLHYQPEGSSGDGGELDVEAPGLTPINTLP